MTLTVLSVVAAAVSVAHIRWHCVAAVQCRS